MKRIDLTDPSWSWSRESNPEIDAKAAAAQWSCEKGSDYWRLTESGAVVHNGHACTVQVDGDFSIEGRFAADLATQYDQLGLVALKNETQWLKAGLELEGQIYVGAVHTRETSDWSFQPASVPGEVRIQRRSGTVTVAYRPPGTSDWAMIRQLSLEGQVSVGFYGASPLGPGFRAAVTGLVFEADQ